MKVQIETVRPELKYDAEKNLVYIRLQGRLTEKIILRAFDLAVVDPRYKNGMGRLWDFRDADLSCISTMTIQSMARYSLKFPPGINDVRVAFVTGRDLEFGLARMFESFSAEARTLIEIFDNIEEATSWLAA